MSREGRLVLAARALRTLLFGALSLVLALDLAQRGLGPGRIGLAFTLCLVEDALLSLAAGALANRLGRRRVLVAGALLFAAAGGVLALAQAPAWLWIALVLGVLSPGGLDAGPFAVIEMALLPETVAPERRTRAFAWYNLAAFLPSALGALAAGGWLSFAARSGIAPGAAHRALYLAYLAGGLLLAVAYATFPDRPRAPTTRPGLHRSRRVVLQLSALQALDALAGGFIVQGLLVYWFHLRFGVGAERLGALFFGTNLLSALSFLVAARVAERIGLLNTMVVSHLASNVLLLLVPLASSFPGAALLLLLRHLLSQMDVPTRQAYAMALVDPDERPAAAGFTGGARGLAQAVAPAFSGIAMAGAASGLPFFIAGGLKIVYDLSLFLRFRKLPLESAAREAYHGGRVRVPPEQGGGT
jgi:MFS family permease